MIDLRSDTVTQPSKEMLDAMFQAKVGDDVFGEDPTVNALESYAAGYFGKEAALFCSSGTQTNQIAINVHVQPGDEVICHEESHIYKYEGGGIAKNSGASVRLLHGDRGRIQATEIAKYLNPKHDVHFPLTALVSLEDTANRGGGAIYDFNEIKTIRKLCQTEGLPLHLDGARLMNALVVNQINPIEYANELGFDTGIITNNHTLKPIKKENFAKINWIRISLIQLDEGKNPEDYDFNDFPKEKLAFSYIIYESTNGVPDELSRTNKPYEGTTVERSSSRYSLYSASLEASCQSPCFFA